MYPVAIGDLEMTPDAFEAATPRELYWRLDAYQAREHRALERIAQLAAWVLNPWVRSAVQTHDLIGRPPDRENTWPEDLQP